MAELIPCDLHIHPDYSIDSKTSIESYCVKARAMNIPVIGFSTHYDVNPVRDDIDPFMVVDGERLRADDYAIGRYLDDCYAAREQFPDLQILIGLEIDYFIGVEAEVYRLKNKFPFDYMIGSVHCLDGISICTKDEQANYYNIHPLDKMADNYFDLLYNAANCGLFTFLGHPDYYLRFGTFHYGQDIFDIHLNRLDKVVETAKRNITGFEINTSYRRHGGDGFYPQPAFLQMASKLGATVCAIGSDSHATDHLGIGIADALKTISSLGIEFHPFYETA